MVIRIADELESDDGGILVPGTGLEPAQLAPYAPQTYVSTNFTTRASFVSV